MEKTYQSLVVCFCLLRISRYSAVQREGTISIINRLYNKVKCIFWFLLSLSSLLSHLTSWAICPPQANKRLLLSSATAPILVPMGTSSKHTKQGQAFVALQRLHCHQKQSGTLLLVVVSWVKLQMNVLLGCIDGNYGGISVVSNQ